MTEFLHGLDAQRRLQLETVRSWLEQHGGGDPASLQWLRSGWSLLFRVVSTGKPCVLRVSALRSVDEVEASLAYLRHVHAQGACVSVPIAWPDGRWVRHFEHAGTAFHATWLEYRSGEVVGRDSRNEAIHHAWGRAIAELHDAAETFQPGESSHFLHWRDQLDATRSRISLGDEAERRELEAIEAWLDARPPSGGRFGLTHGDMNAGNAIWNGRRVALIDFEEPCWHGWASDVARPLREMNSHSRDTRRRLRDALVAGYRSERELEEEEVGDLDWYVRFKNLEILMWKREVEQSDARDAEMVELAHVVRNPIAY